MKFAVFLLLLLCLSKVTAAPYDPDLGSVEANYLHSAAKAKVRVEGLMSEDEIRRTQKWQFFEQVEMQSERAVGSADNSADSLHAATSDAMVLQQVPASPEEDVSPGWRPVAQQPTISELLDARNGESIREDPDDQVSTNSTEADIQMNQKNDEAIPSSDNSDNDDDTNNNNNNNSSNSSAQTAGGLSTPNNGTEHAPAAAVTESSTNPLTNASTSHTFPDQKASGDSSATTMPLDTGGTNTTQADADVQEAIDINMASLLEDLPTEASESEPVSMSTQQLIDILEPSEASLPVEDSHHHVQTTTSVPPQAISESLPVSAPSRPPILVDDLSTPEDDSSIPENDSSVPVNDSSIPESDSSITVNGSSIPENDSSVPVNDSSIPENDSSVPVNDSSIPESDSLVPGNDSAIPENDSSVPVNDSSIPEDDPSISLEKSVTDTQSGETQKKPEEVAEISMDEVPENFVKLSTPSLLPEMTSTNIRPGSEVEIVSAEPAVPPMALHMPTSMGCMSPEDCVHLIQDNQIFGPFRVNGILERLGHTAKLVDISVNGRQIRGTLLGPFRTYSSPTVPLLSDEQRFQQHLQLSTER